MFCVCLLFSSALKELSDLELEGSVLQIESAMERRGGSRAGRGGSRSGAGSQTMSFTGQGPQGPQRQPDFPLRFHFCFVWFL